MGQTKNLGGDMQISGTSQYAGASTIVDVVYREKGIYSLLVSLIRQLVVLIPAAFLLSLSGDVNMVWWSFLISESVALAASIFFMTRANKKIIQPLYQHPEA